MKEERAHEAVPHEAPDVGQARDVEGEEGQVEGNVNAEDNLRPLDRQAFRQRVKDLREREMAAE